MRIILALLILFIPVILPAGRWHKCGDGLPSVEVQSLASKSEILFAGTNSNGIFRSTDNGLNWEELSVGSEFEKIGFHSLEIINNTVFAVSESRGLFISWDQGDKWEQKYMAGPVYTNLIYTLTKNKNRIIAGSSGELVFSDDLGQTWERLAADPLFSVTIALAAENNNIVAGTAKGRVLLSTDNGENWELVNDEAGFVLSIAMKGDYIYAGFNGFYRSTDKGETWEPKQNGLPIRDIKEIALFSDNIFVATKYGVYMSGDRGETWEHLTDGMDEQAYVTSLTITNNTLFAGTARHGIYCMDLSFLGVEDYETAEEKRIFGIYPNPAKDRLIVRAGPAKADNYTIKILDNTGMTVLRKESSDYPETTLNIGGLPPGTYFITIYCGKDIYYDKFLKWE